MLFFFTIITNSFTRNKPTAVNDKITVISVKIRLLITPVCSYINAITLNIPDDIKRIRTEKFNVLDILSTP